MANEEQLNILLLKGVEGWNKWRLDNPNVDVDLTDADLTDADLREANLSGANLSRVNFSKAQFYQADLSGANLSRANLSESYFYQANLSRANLSESYLYDTYLREANLSRANLKEANLSGAKLIDAKLSGANLSTAKLKMAHVLLANFSEAILTGACIEDWNINSQTNLESIVCDYVYFKMGKKERRPSDPNRNFKPGEFVKLVQKSIETVDLIFSKGIDWQSFLQSFQDLQVEDANGQPAIQAIERKTGGAFVVRVEVPPDANKANIESSFWEKYNPLLEAKDREIKLLSQQTDFYSQQVEVIRKDNTKLISIVETMVEKETIKVQQNIYAPVTGLAGNVEGNQNIFSSPSITEASQEILNLLTTLKNNGLTQEQAEGIVANNLATQAKGNPTFKDKLVNWGKSLGNKAAETFVSEVVKRVIKLALNLVGVPMP